LSAFGTVIQTYTKQPPQLPYSHAIVSEFIYYAST